MSLIPEKGQWCLGNNRLFIIIFISKVFFHNRHQPSQTALNKNQSSAGHFPLSFPLHYYKHLWFTQVNVIKNNLFFTQCDKLPKRCSVQFQILISRLQTFKTVLGESWTGWILLRWLAWVMWHGTAVTPMTHVVLVMVTLVSRPSGFSSVNVAELFRGSTQTCRNCREHNVKTTFIPNLFCTYLYD